ncbi:Ankyrin repeat-containing protein [Vitis vinifera]|uniref:Ankyrin repeat-containing protein n=1 Tax=Vitis vinifera TaxID=29760 RepID=A0A438GMF8_VITVI|nr:Ankyrin repeat-containing protein [Vitis vinifera]
MADSSTSKLNLSTEPIQIATEDARELQITNQATAEDGSLTQITFMNPKLYVAAADRHIHVLKKYDEIHVQLTPKKNTVLHVAAQFGRADCVKWILQLPSPSSLLQQPNEKGDTALHLAAREGHLTVVKNLIDAAKQPKRDLEGGSTAVCKVMLRMTNGDKDTALHEAVRHHHPKVVKLLIQEDPEFTYGANTEGNTPLYIAAERGFRDLVHMILDNCSSPAHDGVNGGTALHAAILSAMTRKILTWNPALTKQLDANGWSPLHFAAYVGCHRTIVRQLLKNSDRYVIYLGVKDHGIGKRTALCYHPIKKNTLISYILE